MPLDKFVLIVVTVMAAAGVTVWLAVMVASAYAVSGAAWLILVPVALFAYVLWRVIADRLTNREDDHYDHIEK